MSLAVSRKIKWTWRLRPREGPTILDLELGPLREEASTPYVHPKNLGGYYRVHSERVLIDPTFPTQFEQKVAYPEGD